jgi:hypothetical protein
MYATLLRSNQPRVTRSHDFGIDLIPAIAEMPGVQMWPDYDGTILFYCFTHEQQFWMCVPEIANFCYDDRTEEVQAFALPSASSATILETYYRTVLPVMLQGLGTEVLHASGICASDGIAAFCGVSMTGKSTIAYGLSQRGYRLWADDAIAFELFDRGLLALPLQSDIRLRPSSAAYFAQNQTASVSTSDRSRDNLSSQEPKQLVVLCLLQRMPAMRGGAPVQIRRLPPTEAFLAALGHAYCFSLQNMERKRHMMQRYLELTTRVTVFEIRFQSGLKNLPAILDALEQVLDGASSAMASPGHRMGFSENAMKSFDI